jgi:hypothetical protein
MNKMLIINAPAFFSATWRIIKAWIDPRTASKIEVISNKAAGEKRLLELVAEDQLPSDYGGKGPDTEKTMRDCYTGKADEVQTRMMYLRGHSSETIELKEGEAIEIVVYTRSTAGAKFCLTNTETKQDLTTGTEVKHTGTGEDVHELPTHISITTEKIQGPVKLKIKADSHAGRFSRNDYLLVFYLYGTRS